MTTVVRRVPNFAGIALVDILANGVAVLIIVIVLSIASRTEQEKHFSERIREVSAVMTREFSTSLVLNRLAAGPPALLHDYENSELDQIWDPMIMPVLEIHTNLVRDPYSGRTWSRQELLREPNSLDTFLGQLDSFQRNAIRGDFYDVGTYYLLMSILKDHEITISHWHFIGPSGTGVLVSPGQCPPGVSAKDCNLGTGGQGSVSYSELLDSLNGDSGESGSSNGTEANWPPEPSGSGSNEGSSGSGSSGGGLLPEGSQLTSAGEGNSLDAGSFPDARETRARLLGGGSGRGGGSGSSSSSGNISIRLSDPTASLDSINLIGMDALTQSPEQLLAGLMVYLTSIQTLFDTEQPPTQHLNSFLFRLMAAMSKTDSLTEEQENVVEDLALALQLRAQHLDGPLKPEPLLLSPISQDAEPSAFLRVATNRIISDAEIESNNLEQLNSLPQSGKVRFVMQAYPDIWRGMQISLERNAILMMSPNQTEMDTAKWRALAYISPQIDDFIVGFVYSRVVEGELLEIAAESNSSIVETHSISPLWDVKQFGISAWRTLIYVGLGFMLIGLLVFWRPGVLRRS